MADTNNRSTGKGDADPNIDPALTGGSGGTGKVLWPTGLIGAGGKSSGEGEKQKAKYEEKAKAKEDAPAAPKPRVYSTQEVVNDPALRALSRAYTNTPDPVVWKRGSQGLGPNGTYLYPPPPN